MGAIPPGWWESLSARILNRTLLNDPFERATFYFIGKIANRSTKHRIITSLYTGAGIALAISFAFVFDPKSQGTVPFKISPMGALEAPVMLTFLTKMGVPVPDRPALRAARCF